MRLEPLPFALRSLRAQLLLAITFLKASATLSSVAFLLRSVLKKPRFLATFGSLNTGI
jgi:hypothetical protein